MFLHTILICLALISQNYGLRIIHPDSDFNWTSSGPNVISWSYNATTDPKFVNIQLAHNNQTTFEEIPGLLPSDGIIATGVDVTDIYMLFTPSCFPGGPSLPTGVGYSIRFIAEQPDGSIEAVSAQNLFSIVDAAPSVCLSQTSTSASPSSTATASSSLSSTSSSSHVGAIVGGIIGGLALCFLVLGLMVYQRSLRRKRLAKTHAFGAKKGIADIGIGKPINIDQNA